MITHCISTQRQLSTLQRTRCRQLVSLGRNFVSLTRQLRSWRSRPHPVGPISSVSPRSRLATLQRGQGWEGVRQKWPIPSLSMKQQATGTRSTTRLGLYRSGDITFGGRGCLIHFLPTTCLFTPRLSTINNNQRQLPRPAKKVYLFHLHSYTCSHHTDVC